MPSPSTLLLRGARSIASLRWQAVLRAANALVAAGRVGRDAWRRLSEREQQELIGLVRASNGRPGRLSAAERARLRALVGKALGLAS